MGLVARWANVKLEVHGYQASRITTTAGIGTGIDLIRIVSIHLGDRHFSNQQCRESYF